MDVTGIFPQKTITLERREKNGEKICKHVGET